ncbi:ketosteroid isomerase family protein [Mycolicibacterium komossense]|uniref:Nuclear transport factor 2 family protein n=1 Tax=Mycolicibacterium komossense TaxID=1779 RepID=A0ABT3C819_9MYCO|nr:ketosteroid isomerase family protein [Mycolicibacterium komossense]MCV7225591.1 nuclear transport factor 2 family protein [Mycolicibacterium komossense]
MTQNDREILAAAERSLQAAGRGDRSGWVGLFTPDGRVEDPVGSRPHIGPDQISAFFDTFIGPRQLSYRSTADIVSGSTVLRDLTLDVRMGSAVVMAIPAFLRYSVRESGGELKIAELQAYWELPPMILQFGRHGLRAAAPGLALARALLANQGPGGAIGFVRGLRRVGTSARRTLDGLLGAVAGGDEVTTRRLLGSAAVILGDASPIGLEQLTGRLRGAHFAKYIAAGPAIAVSVVNGDERGVLIADFTRDRSISRLRYFAP